MGREGKVGKGEGSVESDMEEGEGREDVKVRSRNSFWISARRRE